MNQVKQLLAVTAVFAAVPSISYTQNMAYWESVPVTVALDLDRNLEIDQAEMSSARESLLTLDADDNGVVSEAEMGGPGSFPGWVRLQTAVRIIDRNGDMDLSADELEGASAQLKRLDHDHDGKLVIDELVDARINRPAINATNAGGANAMGMGQQGMGQRGMAGTGGPPPQALARMEEARRAREMPGGNIEYMLSVILNNPEVNDPILPGEDDRAWDGFTLFSESSIAADVQIGSATLLLDSKGNEVHRWESMQKSIPEGAAVYLLENGLLLRQNAPDDWVLMEEFEVGSHGIVELVDWDGNVVWSYQRCEVDRYCLHHDLEPLPNGNILVLSYEAMPADEVKAMGWNPRSTRTAINAGQGANSPREPEVIWMEKILELKPDIDTGSTEVVWEWNSRDHLVQSVDPDKPNYGVVSEHPGKIDLNFRPLQSRLLHFNSIDYNPETEQILLSLLMFGEIWVLDHSTTTTEAATDEGGRYGQGGDIIYRWGNPAAYDSGDVSERQLQGQHDARWLLNLPGNGGELTVHNNAAGNVEGAIGRTMFQVGSRYSSVVELDVPMNEDGSYEREAGKAFGGEVTWSFTAEPRESWYAPFMSGASRLPNGNTLVINSHNKRIFEVTSEGERVLDYNFPGLGRMFRVYKLPADYPGLSGKL